MHALWYDGAKFLLRDDVPMPAVSGNEMLIQVISSGICRTDIEIGRGYMKFSGVPGHEFVGKVVDGFDKNLIGKLVVGEINIPCGKCAHCGKGGDPRHCPNREVLGILKRNGTFATHVILPATNLYVVPPNVPDNMLVFTEPLAAALRIIEQVAIAPPANVVVVGDGKLGLLVSAVLIHEGYGVIIVGHHLERARLPLIKKSNHVLEKDAMSMDKVPIVVETSGNSDGLRLALNLVEPGGVIILKSTLAEHVSPSMNDIVVNEIQLVGSRCGPFKPALEMLIQGKIDPRCLIQAEYPLEEAEMAMAHASKPGSLKIILNMQ